MPSPPVAPAIARIVVSGAEGFLGRWIVRHFSDRGSTVAAIPKSCPLESCRLIPLLEAHQPTLIVHAAGPASVMASVENPLQDFHRGVVATAEMLEATRLAAPSAFFVFLSSAAVYGNPDCLPVGEADPVAPLSPYGFHKVLSERLIAESREIFGLRGACLRIFSGYGEGLHKQVLWDICRKALHGRLELQGDGSQTRDFVHARDVVRAIEVLATAERPVSSVYNLAFGEEISIAQATEWICSELALPLTPLYDGILPVGTPSRWKADVSLLKTLGWSPQISPETGIRNFARWAARQIQTKE